MGLNRTRQALVDQFNENAMLAFSPYITEIVQQSKSYVAQLKNGWRLRCSETVVMKAAQNYKGA